MTMRLSIVSSSTSFSSFPSPFFLLVVLSLSVVGGAAVLAVVAAAAATRDEKDDDPPSQREQSSSSSSIIQIAFLGNSMLYFNDCPRLLQQMIDASSHPKMTCIQDSCLRGGASLPSLFEKGNGMTERFATPQALTEENNNFIQRSRRNPQKYDIGAATVPELLQSRAWDTIIMNDYTQAPARSSLAAKSRQVLRDSYAPYFRQILQQRSSTGACRVILIQTPAYRKPGINQSEDLGDFHAMTDALAAGVQSYVDTLNKECGIPAQIAPVGEAYRYLKLHHLELFHKLYSWDDFHPSPYGTWLQACVLYAVLFQTPPPPYNAMWWEQSRYMQPPDQKPLPLPTDAEAAVLAQVACTVLGIDPKNNNHHSYIDDTCPGLHNCRVV